MNLPISANTTSKIMKNHILKRIDASGIQALLNSTHSLEPKAVLIQFLVMTALSLLTIITFNILRPNNKTVYEPKIKYHEHDKHPPYISDSCCGWIIPLFRVNEEHLVDNIGPDAVAFLRFLRLMRWFFTLTALYTCGVLIPLDFLYTLSVKPTGYDILTAMTIQDVQGNRLYAHIGAIYLITVVLISLVFYHWRVMYQVRNQWYKSSQYQRLFHARTLCITHVPKRRQSTAGLLGIFNGMQLNYPVTSVYMGKAVGELPQLIARHNELVEEYEEVLLRHMRDEKSKDERPTITVGGYCGICGRQQDAIKYYSSKLKRSEAMIQQYRAQIETHGPENFGFATMASIPLAHEAARELKGMHPKGLTFKLAPNPNDIIWKNMGLSKVARRFRRISGFILLWTFCFLSLIPLFPIASLANLNAIASSGYIPFLQMWLEISPVTYTLASGLLPPAIASIFGSVIPILMRWLSKYMGATTRTSLDRIFIARYFAFLVISQLALFTVIGVLFHAILEIIIAIQSEGASLRLVLENLDKLPARLASTYVDQSSFWLKWFALRGFLIIFNLAQLFNLISTSCKTRFSGHTPREIREWSKPPMFSFGIHYANLLFVGLIGLLFAPVAPLVSLAAAILFWFCSWVYKYQLIYKFITRVETGGRAWNMVINRLLFSCIFMQVVMVITIGFQAEFKSLKFLATLPPILFTVACKHFINQKFANDFEFYIPPHSERSRSLVHTEAADVTEDKLGKRYENPALRANVFSPMVHESMMPLLQHLYKGKSNHDDDDLTRGVSRTSKKEKAVADDSVEGVGITPVNETELEYDPSLYKRDREVDCDFDSVNETSSPNGHPHMAHQVNPQTQRKLLEGRFGHEHTLPPNHPISDGIGAPRIANYGQQQDRKPSLSMAAPPHHQTSKHINYGHDPRRLHEANEQPLSQSGHARNVRRQDRTYHPMQHGGQNDGSNLNFGRSRERNPSTAFNTTIIASGSGGHAQNTDQPMLRTYQTSQERTRKPRLPRHEATTPPPH